MTHPFPTRRSSDRVWKERAMSIEKMIHEHPDVGADYNSGLGLAVKHATYCAAICNACADACSAEEMDMRRCIRLCMDCSDVCTRSEEHTSELQSLMRISYAVFCLKQKTITT